MQMGNDPIAGLRAMLSRPVTVEDALAPYLGIPVAEANKDADAEETSDGLLRDRLHDLILILALREAPSTLARLVARLVWRAAPVAESVEEVVEAIRVVATWLGSLDGDDVARIVTAHQAYETGFDDIVGRTGEPEGPEIDALLRDLQRDSAGDHAVSGLGDSILVVEMSSSHYFVGLQEADGTVFLIDMVPHSPGGGGGWDGDEPEPDAPRPMILQDA